MWNTTQWPTRCSQPEFVPAGPRLRAATVSANAICGVSPYTNPGRKATMAQQVKVSIDTIEVIKDGDPSGKGELYWYFQADSTMIDDKGVSNPRKTASGEGSVSKVEMD
jgi:hypothetical protein